MKSKYGLNRTFYTRPIIERMERIRQHLVTGEPFTDLTIARELEVSRKTIQRDREFMQNRLGYEMEWNATKNTWEGSAPKAIL